MPELSDIFKDAIGDVPEFDVLTLVARQRQHRRLQGAGVAGVVAVAAIVTVTVVAASAGSSDHVSIRTRDSDDTSPTTVVVSSSGSFGTTLPPDTKSSTRTTGIVPPPTVTTPDSATTTLPGSRAAQADDFTGTLNIGPTTITVYGSADFDLQLHNVTNHVIDVSGSNEPTSVGVMCAPTTGGRPNGPLLSDVNFWFVTAPPLEPGGDDGRTATYRPRAGDVGSVTCEAAIVSSADGWASMNYVARVTAIPAVTLTVLPGADATTTTRPAP